MIVAIESASTDLSVALASSDGIPIAADAWSSDRRQGHEILPRLLALLAAHGRGLHDVGLVAIGIGPGSFTGLRVGMSLAKGLAYALKVPIVGVPSLEAWLVGEPEALAAITRAGAREAYLALRDDPQVSVFERGSLPAQLRGAVVVAADELATAFGIEHARPPSAAAGAIARLAVVRPVDDLDSLEPGYLRLPRGIGQAREGVVRWL